MAAKVIGHDVDLALVSVADEAFWTEPEPLGPITWDDAEFAELYSEVAGTRERGRGHAW